MKIFTDTNKWQSEWFIKLPPMQKLGYLYLLETSDSAGVFERPGWMADMAINGPDGQGKVDWDELFEVAGITELANGKFWISDYLDLQCPTGVKATTKGQSKIRESIAKNSLPIEIEGGNGNPFDTYPLPKNKVSDTLPKGNEYLPEEEEEEEEEEDKEKDRTRTSKSKEDTQFWQQVQDLYNEVCPKLKVCRVVNDKRKKLINLRGKECNHDLDVFRQVFTYYNQSPHHIGQNNRNWIADIEFVLREEPFAKGQEEAPLTQQQIVEQQNQEALNMYIGGPPPPQPITDEDRKWWEEVTPINE